MNKTAVILPTLSLSVAAVYHGLQDHESSQIKFNNGMLDPNSVDKTNIDSDFFLKDLYDIATAKIMVNVSTAYEVEYQAPDGSIKSEPFYPTYDDNDEFDPMYAINGDYGFHVQGNTDQTLLPVDGLPSGKRSTNNGIQVIVNAYGTLNHRTVGLAHELGHVLLFLKNLPFSHGQLGVDDFVYGKSTLMSKRLGYDY